MIIKHFEEVEATVVDDPLALRVAKRLLLSEADGAANFRMRLFEVEPGGHTPFHRHPYEHEVFVVEGTGRYVDKDGHEHPIRSGHAVFVPPDEMHQFRNAGQTALRLLCLIPTPRLQELRRARAATSESG